MQSPILRVVREAPKLFKRNLGISAPVLQKASDPIQQLFVDKIREYKSKSRYAIFTEVKWFFNLFFLLNFPVFKVIL